MISIRMHETGDIAALGDHGEGHTIMVIGYRVRSGRVAPERSGYVPESRYPKPSGDDDITMIRIMIYDLRDIAYSLIRIGSPTVQSGIKTHVSDENPMDAIYGCPVWLTRVSNMASNDVMIL